MYVYKSNEKKKFWFFWKMKKWEKIFPKKNLIFFFSFDLNAIVYQNALKHVLNIN